MWFVSRPSSSSSLNFDTVDLDKTYNDKLCLEYELNASPGHLTTTDECILAALRKLASLEQQIAQVIRENQTYLFEYQQRLNERAENKDADLLIDFGEDSHQQLLDVHKKQVRRPRRLCSSLNVYV